ncbi:MAG: hypothetical protein ACE5WD_05690 [Candidatus Aminicenantia bacterium]
MIFLTNKSGKIFVVLLIIIILILIAFGAGYYLSMMRYEKEFNQLEEQIKKFEANYEYRLTSLESNMNKVLAFISEREGKTKEQVDKIKTISLLLKAKGEIISSKLSLAKNNTEKSFEQIDNAILTLQETLVLSEKPLSDMIEKIRLDLATVKGMLESDVEKAQKELDNLWRRIDDLISQKIALESYT